MYFRTRFIILNHINKRGQEIMFAQRLDQKRVRYRIFSYNFYTCTNPFIHLLRSSLIQWIIVIINGREEPKQNLHLGGPKSSENLPSGLPRWRCLYLGGALHLGIGVSRRNRNDQFFPFLSELFQPKHTISKQNHKTNLNQPKTHVLKS